MAHTIDINIPQNLPKKEVERGKNYVVEEAHGCNPRLRPCPPPSDEELDRLKNEYEAKITEASKAIHEAELARDALVQKALDLNGVAQQGTNPDTSLTIVDDKIGNKLSISNDNVMGRLAALLSKMGTPALGQAATLFSAIAEIASSIDFKPVEEAIAGLDEKIGTSTDASTVASLFGRLAALIGSLGTPTSLLDDSVQARLASLLAKAGTPALGQASTLFGAIAQVASSIDFTTVEEAVDAVKYILTIPETIKALGTDLTFDGFEKIDDVYYSKWLGVNDLTLYVEGEVAVGAQAYAKSGSELVSSGTVSQVSGYAMAKESSVQEVLLKIYEFYDTFDADFALQLDAIIGHEYESESESGEIVDVSQTEQQIERLRTLRDFYFALLGLIGESTDTASAATIFGKLAAVIGALADMQGDNLDATNTAILAAFDDIHIDTDTIAKQGSNENANISDIQASLGTSTSLLDNTVQARLASTLAKIGSPAVGQPATLFAAIAAGGGGGGDELLENFFGITEATEYTPATSQEIEDELEDMWELVTGEPAPHTDESESEIPDMSDSPSVTPH